LSSGNLASITDPDGGVRTFTYNSSHQLTNDTFVTLQNNYAYGNGNILTTITLGSSSSPSVSKISPAVLQGFYTPGQMGQPSPSVAGPIQAKLTDPDTHVTAWQLDGQGRPLQIIAADGSITQYTRDASTTWVTK